jgi:hypothetical protein
LRQKQSIALLLASDAQQQCKNQADTAYQAAVGSAKAARGSKARLTDTDL